GCLPAAGATGAGRGRAAAGAARPPAAADRSGAGTGRSRRGNPGLGGTSDDGPGACRERGERPPGGRSVGFGGGGSDTTGADRSGHRASRYRGAHLGAGTRGHRTGRTGRVAGLLLRDRLFGLLHAVGSSAGTAHDRRGAPACGGTGRGGALGDGEPGRTGRAPLDPGRAAVTLRQGGTYRLPPAQLRTGDQPRGGGAGHRTGHGGWGTGRDVGFGPGPGATARWGGRDCVDRAGGPHGLHRPSRHPHTAAFAGTGHRRRPHRRRTEGAGGEQHPAVTGAPRPSARPGRPAPARVPTVVQAASPSPPHPQSSCGGGAVEARNTSSGVRSGVSGKSTSSICATTWSTAAAVSAVNGCATVVSAGLQ